LPFMLMFVGERMAFPALSDVKLHPAFGLVILMNFVGSSVYLVMQGTAVSQAREKYKVELPEMYATERGPDGKLTENAYKFNCVRRATSAHADTRAHLQVQRAHQQAFETYPQFLVLSAVSGLQYPMSTAAMGLLWIAARKAWADGYSTGVPMCAPLLLLLLLVRRTDPPKRKATATRRRRWARTCGRRSS